MLKIIGRVPSGAIPIAGIVFLSIGTLLLIMGVTLLPGCGQRSASVDWSDPNVKGTDLVLAEVNGQPITAGYVYHKIRLQYPQMPNSGPSLGSQSIEVVKQTVVERCFEEMALKHGWDRNPEFLRMMALSRMHLLSRIVGDEIAARATPPEEDLRQVYDSDKERFRVKAAAWYSHILVNSEAEAQRIMAELRAGADFGELAKKYSRDAVTAPKGGEMPPAQADGRVGHLGNLPELTAVVLATEDGQIAGPVHTAKGWHIIKVSAKRADRQMDYDEVRGDIAAKERAKVESQIYSQVIDSLKTALNVVYHNDNMDKFTWLQMDDEQLFSAAQREQDSARKVRMYEQIVERYPQSARCPEALFMIGFESAERMADTTRAVQTFERFLADYPQHELAASARLMLDDLRRTP